MLILNNRRITVDEVANQLQISYSHKESSSMDFSFMKFVWVPKQFTEWPIRNCLDICDHFWNQYSWRGQHIFKSYCCWWWNVDSTLRAREKMSRVWNGNTRRYVRKEVQILASSEECYACTVLGYEVTAPWALSRKRCNNKQYTLQWECMTSWSQRFGVKACCSLTELISVLLPTLLKHFRSYTEIGIYTIQLWPCSTGVQSPLKGCCFSSNHVLKEVVHIWLTAQLKKISNKHVQCWTSSVEKGTMLENNGLVSYILLLHSF
jgi:hypothetical protein